MTKIIQMVSFLFFMLFELSCSYPEIYNEKLKFGGAYVGIELICDDDTIESGSAAIFELYGIFESGEKSLIRSEEIQWSTSDPQIAEISIFGEVAAHLPGNVSITAAYREYETTANILITRGVMKGDILITEVLYDPDGIDTGREYIELANTTLYDLPLKNLYLIDGNNSSIKFFFPAASSLQGGGRIIIAAAKESFFIDYGFYPSHEGLKFQLNNTGEAVFLFKGDGLLLDEVYICGGTADHPQPALWGAAGSPSAPQGRSVMRINLIDTGASSDWRADVPDPGR